MSTPENPEQQKEPLALLQVTAEQPDGLSEEAQAGLSTLANQTRPAIDEALTGESKPIPGDVEHDTETHKLSPEQQTAFLSTLEARLSSEPESYRRAEGVNFPEVKAALEANPQLMWSLAQMDSVDIRAIEGNEFVFAEFAKETDKSRRNLTYYQVQAKAKEMGVDIESEEGWRALQELCKVDLESWIYVNSDDIIDTGDARRADRHGDYLDVYRNYADNRSPIKGWRASLRVPKA